MIWTKKHLGAPIRSIYISPGRFYMSRFMLAILLATPGLLLADEISNQQCEQCTAGDCRDCRCDHCGCQAHCQKICHPVCEWKDVTETVYACRCKDICIPGHSEKECTVNDECNPYNCPLLHDYKPLYSIWNPAECARSRSVTKLVKLEVTHKVPVYKWVVEYCCPQCCSAFSNGGSPNGEAGNKQVQLADKQQIGGPAPIAQPVANSTVSQQQIAGNVQPVVPVQPIAQQIAQNQLTSQPQPEAVPPASILQLAAFNAPAVEPTPPNRPAWFQAPEAPPSQPELSAVK
jgi:hypothetical protein